MRMSFFFCFSLCWFGLRGRDLCLQRMIGSNVNINVPDYKYLSSAMVVYTI